VLHSPNAALRERGAAPHYLTGQTLSRTHAKHSHQARSELTLHSDKNHLLRTRDVNLTNVASTRCFDHVMSRPRIDQHSEYSYSKHYQSYQPGQGCVMIPCNQPAVLVERIDERVRIDGADHRHDDGSRIDAGDPQAAPFVTRLLLRWVRRSIHVRYESRRV
jgi:hypothetical protein